MSLPGLELTQPSEERLLAVAPPSQIALKAGSEWRFEVAFGHIVRVKVRDTPYIPISRVADESELRDTWSNIANLNVAVASHRYRGVVRH